MRVVLAGVPTSVDIKKLQDQWPTTDMKPGDEILYDEAAELLGVEIGSRRFQTITNRWRNIVERDSGKRIAAVDGKFRVLTESEKLIAIEHKSRSIQKQTRKNYIRTGWIDRKVLNDDEKTRLDHATLQSRNVLAARQLKQNIALPEL